MFGQQTTCFNDKQGRFFETPLFNSCAVRQVPRKSETNSIYRQVFNPKPP